MKALREVWDFIGGGSVASPIALALAIAIAIAPLPIGESTRAILFLATIVMGFIAATYERC